MRSLLVFALLLSTTSCGSFEQHAPKPPEQLVMLAQAVKAIEAGEFVSPGVVEVAHQILLAKEAGVEIPDNLVQLATTIADSAAGHPQQIPEAVYEMAQVVLDWNEEEDGIWSWGKLVAEILGLVWTVSSTTGSRVWKLFGAAASAMNPTTGINFASIWTAILSVRAAFGSGHSEAILETKN